VNLDIGVGLVIAQSNVEPGSVLLDEHVLQDERFNLILRDDPVEVDYLWHEACDSMLLLARLLEVGSDATSEDDGFADVDDVT